MCGPALLIINPCVGFLVLQPSLTWSVGAGSEELVKALATSDLSVLTTVLAFVAHPCVGLVTFEPILSLGTGSEELAEALAMSDFRPISNLASPRQPRIRNMPAEPSSFDAM